MPPLPVSKTVEMMLTRRKLFEKIMQHVASRKIQNHVQATGDRMAATPQQFGMQIGKTMGKQAFLGPGLLGAGMGAMTSPEGHRMEGAGRGAVKATGTTLGAAAGIPAGILAALMLIKGKKMPRIPGGVGARAWARRGARNMANMSTAVGVGAPAGAAVGGGAGYAGTSAFLGKPSWEKKEASVLSTIGGGLGAGVGGLAGLTGGGLLGALTGGAMGGAHGAGLGLLGGGALGLGAGAHLGGNIGASIGKKKKEKPAEKDEKPEAEEKDDKGDEEVKESSSKKLIDAAMQLSDSALNKLVPARAGTASGAALRAAHNSGTFRAPIYLNAPGHSLFGHTPGDAVMPDFRQYLQNLIRSNMKRAPADALAKKQPGSVLARQEAKNYW